MESGAELRMKSFGDNNNKMLTRYSGYKHMQLENAISPVFEGLDTQFPNGRISETGFCQTYRGAACAKFIGNQSIFVRSPVEQGLNEDKLTEALTVIATSGDLSPRCAEFAIPSLCYNAFPPCIRSSDGTVSPKLICREECEYLENEICRVEFALAKKHSVIGPKMIVPDCQDLPSQETIRKKQCLQLSIATTADSESIQRQNCYTGKGMDYRGSMSETVSGYKCLKWSLSSMMSLKTSHFPELIGGHNFCRNPGGVEDQPWCFTTSDSVEKEVCSVPKCCGAVELKGMFAHVCLHRTFKVICISAIKNNYQWLYVAIPTILAVVICSVIFLFWWRRRHGLSKPLAKAVTPTTKPYQNQQLELSSLLPKMAVCAREFSMSQIRFEKELGEGAFGKVYKGELVGISTDGMGHSTPVAIKTVKANATLKAVQDFRREVELLSNLRHPNVICLLGVSIKEQPLSMIFEYMTQGNLHEFLIIHGPNSDVSASSADGTCHVLDQADFMYIAVQISAGMEYLSGHHYIHRDLAARNCLVGDQLTVKISDFGLSRDIYASDYYRIESQSLLPVRWMPPEAILYGKFTTESDVWSFGILLWETYSFGLQPYFGFSNQEVIEMVRSRHLLPCPEECPSHVYALMVECWHEIPARRPAFREIHTRLKMWDNLLMAGSRYSTNTDPSNNTSSSCVSQGASPYQRSLVPPPPIGRPLPNLPFLKGAMHKSSVSPHLPI
uniref:Tyrosine-protein kinase receptor n=1 Tax=Strigamia maritima TaxID=126957 RepID=T1IWC4_STRMM